MLTRRTPAQGLHGRRRLDPAWPLFVLRRLPCGEDAEGQPAFLVPGATFDPASVSKVRLGTLFRARFIAHEPPRVMRGQAPAVVEPAPVVEPEPAPVPPPAPPPAVVEAPIPPVAMPGLPPVLEQPPAVVAAPALLAPAPRPVAPVAPAPRPFPGTGSRRGR